MPHRFPVPAEERLPDMLAAAYERLPGPEPARLLQLGERLARARPVARSGRSANSIPWWIVVLMLSGAAAATWYAGELKRPDVVPVTNTGGMDDKPVPVAEPARKVEQHPAQPDHPALIDERETP